MCNRIHIYLVDEESLQWLIANECVGERFVNNKYTKRFIIKDWLETNEEVYIRFIGYNKVNKTQ